MLYSIPIRKSKSWNTFISETLLTQSRDPFESVIDVDENRKKKESGSLYEFKLNDKKLEKKNEKLKPADNKNLAFTSSLFNTIVKS